jgi:iron complex transport system ATP-binding protein
MQTPTPFIVEVKNASTCIQGSQILFDVSWEMMPNENWAIIGNNGAGKSTFIRLVFGDLIPIHSGTVFWFGQRHLIPILEIRKKIGVVSAEYQADYHRNATGLEVALSGFFSSIGLYKKPGHVQTRNAMEWMDYLKISHLSKKRFHSMSYGEARRVLLARALVNQPELLILDEPCSGLDIPSKEVFLRTVEQATKIGTQMILVSHHIEEIIPNITHVLYFKNGKVFKQGPKEEMLKPEIISEALGCQINLKENEGRYWITGCNPYENIKTP